MSKALTDAGIRKLAREHAGQRVNVSDPGCHGLKLRLGASGRKTWALYYWRGGTQRTYTIGTYPEPWGLADAREEARRLQRLISQGGDPAQERRQARQQAPQATTAAPPGLTVAEVIEAYLADLGARARPATVRYWSRAPVAPRRRSVLPREQLEHFPLDSGATAPYLPVTWKATATQRPWPRSWTASGFSRSTSPKRWG